MPGQNASWLTTYRLITSRAARHAAVRASRYRGICIKHLATSNRYPPIRTHQSQSKWHFNNIRAIQSHQQGFRHGRGLAKMDGGLSTHAVVMERAYFDSGFGSVCGRAYESVNTAERTYPGCGFLCANHINDSFTNITSLGTHTHQRERKRERATLAVGMGDGHTAARRRWAEACGNCVKGDFRFPAKCVLVQMYISPGRWVCAGAS